MKSFEEFTEQTLNESFMTPAQMVDRITSTMWEQALKSANGDPEKAKKLYQEMVDHIKQNLHNIGH